jgi:hypothetical protein
MVLLIVATLLATNVAPANAASGFSHLDPGGPPNLTERVPVQFVFVGFTSAQVSQASFTAQLPTRYKPVVRSRGFYGITERLGIDYTFDYSVTYTSASFNDSFFGALTSLATKESTVDGRTRTLFQQAYNDQQHNSMDVTENWFIDAPSVEKWLIDHQPTGVDTRRNTVFFVNWWGRTGESKFKFHTYTKFGEPDPDTNYDFGRNRQSRKIIAWGGTTPDDPQTGLGVRGERRIWFFDPSAGPESWGGSWNVDDADLDGDGIADYRIPAIWEYGVGGYRLASALASDLGKVARYGAINLLFTPSALYPPYITPNRQPFSINLDLNTYEGWKGTNASLLYQKPALMITNESQIHRITYTADQQDLAFTGKAKQCFDFWLIDRPCYPDRPYPAFANLFVYNALHRQDFVDGGGEYEAMFFNYATDDDSAPGFLGFADDNYVDGTQSFTFNFVSPSVVAAGYGLTTTQIHEYGHHFGMSHPHDGYDSQTGVDYEPTGAFFFAWATDEVNSMMSYIDLNWEFSQFDRDNANRFQATAYIKTANAIAADVLRALQSKGTQQGDDGKGDLRRADAEIGLAKIAIVAHNYVGTFDHAKRAYEYVRKAAAENGVSVTASTNGWSVLPPTTSKPSDKGYAYVDKIGPFEHRAAR